MEVIEKDGDLDMSQDVTHFILKQKHA